MAFIAETPPEDELKIQTLSSKILLPWTRLASQQRATVAPSVAPSNLANFQPLIRARVEDILDNLPVVKRLIGSML